MRLLAELLLVLIGSNLLLGSDIAFPSGDGAIASDTEGDAPEGSGQNTFILEEGDVEGSGAITTEAMPITKNMKCTSIYCWCVYDDGTEVPRTKLFGSRVTGCDKYGGQEKPTASSTVKPPIEKSGSNSINVGEPHNVPEETESEKGEDWTFEEPTTTESPASSVAVVSTKKPVPVVIDKSTAKPEKIDNNIPVITDEPKVKNIDESEEEETNIIGGDNSKVFSAAVIKEDMSAGGLILGHPGILAAIIGGAVVGLLCAILLIMFIVYRMRKKDEGSYPLNDTKPLKNYAYAKAPSREFYA